MKMAQLSKLTNLSVATCSNILKLLIRSGQVIEKEIKESDGGRPARFFMFNASHANVACFLLKSGRGYSGINYVVSDAGGKVIGRGEKFIRNLTFDDIEALLASIRNDFAIKVLAIAFPGIIAGDIITESNIPGLVGLEIGKRIREKFDLDVVIDNDMNFAAIAYHNSNTKFSNTDLAFLAFPANGCPGCGLIINNNLVRGWSNFAGEIATIIPLLKPSAGRSSNKEQQRAVLAGRIAATVSAILNPKVIVIAGETIQPNMYESITATCKTMIPEKHMPTIIIQPDYENECFQGMQLVGLNSLMYSDNANEASTIWYRSR